MHDNVVLQVLVVHTVSVDPAVEPTHASLFRFPPIASISSWKPETVCSSLPDEIAILN